MFAWENVKNPTEIKRYAFDWSDELATGDAIDSCSAVLVSGYGAGLTIVTDDQFDGVLSFVKLSGGTAGQVARIQGTVITVAGDRFDEEGFLTIADPSDPLTSELTDLRADLIALRRARVEALTGGQVKEVWREGRRVVYNVGSVADISRAIQYYEDLIASKELAVIDSRPRFRALRPRF